jgi:hypothetical protein
VDVQEEKDREAMTTKHDKARLLHLKKDPTAGADWTAALREKDRVMLDTEDPAADPWNRLAEKFNNYEDFQYSNACIVPGARTVTGLYVAVTGMERISTYCHDINPSQPGRPLRDASWMRLQWRDLKSKLSICFNNYRRSGNQEAENLYDLWVDYSSAFNNDIITYARAVLNLEEINHIGRALPTEVQRDTGAIDPEDTIERRREEAQARKRQRLEANSNSRRTSSSTPESSTSSLTANAATPGSAATSSSASLVASVLENGLKQANEIMRLRAIIEFATGEEKEAAIRKLIDLTFP